MPKDPNRHLVDGQYTVRDLVDLKKLRAIFQHFTDTMGFTIGFLSVPDLEILIATGWRDICTKFHRRCSRAAENCRRSNAHLVRQMTKPGKVVVERCDNGLVDCAMPIFIKGKCVAILATGQVLLEAPDLNRFRRQAKAFGCSEKKYMAALAEIPVISSKRLKQVTGFLKELASLVAELGYAGLKEKEKARELEWDIQRRIRAENALKETTDQLQVLYGAVTDGVLVADVATKRILKANANACRMFDYTQKEFLRKKISDLHPSSAVKKIQGFFHEQLSGKRPLVPDVPCRKRDGSFFFADIAAQPVIFEGKSCLVGFFRDISRRKSAEEREREVSRRLEAVFNSTFQLMALLKPDGRILEVNQAALSFGGMTLAQVQGQLFWESSWWTISRAVQQKLRRAVAQAARGKFVRYPVEVLGKQGATMKIDFSLKPIKNERGQVTLLTAEGRDITENTKAEASLQKSAKEWQSTFDAVGDVVWLLNLEGRILRTNKAVFPVLGKKPSEVIGCHCCELVHETRVSPAECPLRRMRQTHRRESWEFLRDDRWFRVTVDPIWDRSGSLIGAVHIVSDITRRKKAQEMVAESSERLSLVLDNSIDLIYRRDLKTGRYDYFSSVVEQHLGYTAEELLGATSQAVAFPRVHPDDLKRVKKVLRDARLGLESKGTLEYRLRHKDGKYRWLSDRFTVLKDASGKPLYWLGVSRDITEQKQTEQALSESERRFRQIVEQAPIAMAIVSLSGVIEFINKKAESVFGYRPQDIPTMRAWWCRAYPDSGYRRKVVVDWTARVKQAIKRGGEISGAEFRVTCKDRTVKTVFISGAAIADKIFVLFDDISLRKQVESKLQMSEERFRSIFESSQDAMMTIEPPLWKFTSGNASMARIFGARRAEDFFIHAPWVLSPRKQPDGSLSSEKARRMISIALRRGSHFFSWMHRRLDGTFFPAEVLLTKVTRKEGSFLQATVRDITERRKAEESLLEGEERFRLVVNNSLDAVYRRNMKNGRYDFFSPSVKAITGFSPQELIGKPLGFIKGRVHSDDLKAAEKILRKAQSGRVKEGIVDYRFRHKNGSYRWLSDRFTVVNDEKGRPLYWVGVSRDVTEQKLGERELQKSEARFRSYFELPLHGIAITSPEKGWIRVNDRLCSLLGYPRRELLRKTWLEMTHPEDVAADTRQFKLMLSGKIDQYSMEKRFIRKDGRVIWTSLAVGCVRRPDGSVDFVCALVDDITARKDAMDALQKSEKLYRLLTENSSDVIWTMNPKSEFTYVSPTTFRLRGYTAEEVMRQPLEKQIAPGSLPLAINLLKNAWAQARRGEAVSPAVAELEQLRKDGTTVWTEVSGELVRDKVNGPFILGVTRDITERRRTAALLKQREAYLTSIIENQPGMVWLKDQESRLLAANHMFAKMAGQKRPEDVVGKTDFDVWPSKMAKKFREDDRRVMKEREHITTEELIPVGGVPRWHETFKMPVFDVQGNVIGTTGFAHDITERKKAEAALQSSEASLKLQLERMPIGAILWDKKLRVLSWNPAAERIFGYSAKEIIGKSAYQYILSKGVAPQIKKIWQRLLQGDRTAHSVNENRTQSGGTILCKWTNTPLRGSDGKVFAVLSMVEDITQYQAAQNALRESEQSLREAQTVAGLGSYVLDVPSRSWKSSDILDKVFGVVRQPQHSLAEWEALVHPDWRVRMRDYLQNEVLEKGDRFDKEYKIIRVSDRQERWVHGLGQLEFDRSGKPIRMVGTVQDITERKNMEQALEKRILALTQPVGGGEGIEFEDLFNIEEIQKIQDEFTRATGVASIITHTDGTPITRPSNFCYLCNDIIRKTQKGLVNCYRSDACIGRPNLEGPIIQTCLSGGLWDAGASIAVGGRHVANWLIGQVRDEAQSEEKIRAYAREIGADEEKAAKAFRDVTPMPRAQFEKVSQLLFTMAKQLSQFAYQNLQQARAITESRRAEALIRAGRHQLFQVIDTVPHMIFAKDREGRFLLVNQAVGNMYGKDPKELIGVRRQDIHKEQGEAEKFLKGDQEVLASGKPMLVSNEPFTDAQGRKHILQTIKIPFNMAGTKDACILGVSVDVTEQRKIEEFRNDIVRTVSHELRTPLSIEKEGISLLIDEMLGPVNPEQKEVLATVMRSIDRLSRMITSLLDISSIETGKIQLSQKITDLTDLVRDVAFEFDKRAKEKGLRLSVQLPGGPVRVLVDADKITQVLSNLVDNAIKFTAKGAVEISLSISKRQAECVVQDTGIGIAEANLGKLFEKFQQFSRTPGPGEKGFGLGLSIAKGIIELHGGRIRIESEMGKGTRVIFSLPLQSAEAPKTAAKSAGSRRRTQGPFFQKGEA